MSRATIRGLGGALLFNGIAVLVSSNAAWNAVKARDLFPVVLFIFIASVYFCGFVLHVAQHRLARAVNHRLWAGGIYLLSAFTTAVTVDDLRFMAAAGGRPYSGWPRALFTASLIGSLVLGLAFMTVLIRPRYGYIVALVGACLAWPSFADLAWNLPWRDFVWLVTIHWDGELQVAAVLSLTAATVYSILQLKILSRAVEIWQVKTR